MARRIVLDTNCLIITLPSASPQHRVWTDFLAGKYVLCVTNEILEEYEEILSVKSSPQIAKAIVEAIRVRSNVMKITPYYHFHLIEIDKDDNKFVDCAIAANADYIVSEDKHFKVLETIPFPKVSVISLDKFVEILSMDSAN